METASGPQTGDLGGARRIWVDWPCDQCAYSLRGLRLSDHCPKCGTPVADTCRNPPEHYLEPPSRTPAGYLDGTGTVCTDCPCRKCGYNLRGLNHTGRCPECGTDVSLSLHGDMLCYSEPGYVERLARGCRLILRGLTILIFAFVALLVGGILFGLASPGGPVTGVLGPLAAVVGAIAALAGAIMFLIGVWYITAREPNVFATARRDTARRLVRIYMLAIFVGLAVGAIAQALAPPLPVMAAVQFFDLGVSILGVVGTAAYFLYLRSLARRVPDSEAVPVKKLVTSATGLARGFAVALGISTLLEAVQTALLWGPALLAPASPTTAPGGPASTSPLAGAAMSWFAVARCSGGLVALALLILFLAAVRLHHRLRKALDQQALLARSNWEPRPSAAPG